MTYKLFFTGSAFGAVLAVILQGIDLPFVQNLKEDIIPEKVKPENKMNVQPVPELLSFTAVECGLAFEYKDHVMLQQTPTFNGTKIPCYKLNYYISDNSIEMVRKSDGQTWYRRAESPDVAASDVYLGNSVTIKNRCFLLSSYSDQATTVVMQHLTQSTFALLKPDVSGRFGDVLSYIERLPDVRVAGLRLTWLSEQQAKDFYAEHRHRDFFQDLVTYIVSGPVLLLHLTGRDVIRRWREALGPTDSGVARQAAPGSLRALFGEDKQRNAAHGSDGEQAAHRELSVFFPGWSSVSQLPSLVTSSELLDVSSLLLLPHLYRQGRVGEVLSSLSTNHSCHVSRIELVRLSYLDAARYTTAQLLPRAPPTEAELAQINDLLSGPCVVMRLAGSKQEQLRDLVKRLKDVLGPADPAKARKAAVESLRSQFGVDVRKRGVVSPWFDWAQQ